MSMEGPRQLPQRAAAACPWCGSGTPLALAGDGMGNVTLCCTVCGCKGPPMPISGDFAEADEAAIVRWSARKRHQPPINAEILARIERSVAVARFVHGEDYRSASISMRLDDLISVLSAVNG